MVTGWSTFLGYSSCRFLLANILLPEIINFVWYCFYVLDNIPNQEGLQFLFWLKFLGNFLCLLRTNSGIATSLRPQTHCFIIHPLWSLYFTSQQNSATLNHTNQVLVWHHGLEVSDKKVAGLTVGDRWFDWNENLSVRSQLSSKSLKYFTG
jgi:hypothetical protein